MWCSDHSPHINGHTPSDTFRRALYYFYLVSHISIYSSPDPHSFIISCLIFTILYLVQSPDHPAHAQLVLYILAG